LTFAAMLTHEL